jgi:hypothetical protein
MEMFLIKKLNRFNSRIRILAKTKILLNPEQCFLESQRDLVVGRMDDMLGADEPRDSRGAQADDAKNLYAFVQVLGIQAQLQEVANVEADEGDFVFQIDLLNLVISDKVRVLEFPGIEAVLDSIAVAGRGTALARGGRGRGHGIFGL